MRIIAAVVAISIFGCSAGDASKELIDSIKTGDVDTISKNIAQYMKQEDELVATINAVFAKRENWKDQKELVARCLSIAARLKRIETVDVLIDSWDSEAPPKALDNANLQSYVSDVLFEIGKPAIDRVISAIADGKLKKRQISAFELVRMYYETEARAQESVNIKLKGMSSEERRETLKNSEFYLRFYK